MDIRSVPSNAGLLGLNIAILGVFLPEAGQLPTRLEAAQVLTRLKLGFEVQLGMVKKGGMVMDFGQ